MSALRAELHNKIGAEMTGKPKQSLCAAKRAANPAGVPQTLESLTKAPQAKL